MGRKYLHRCAVRDQRERPVRGCRCAATPGYWTPALRAEEVCRVGGDEWGHQPSWTTA